MPLSNAWPERGASAVKRLKTRLRNSLKKDMLESLLHITINGPPVEKAEALINTAVAMWEDKKKRRKLRSSDLESFSTENLEEDHHEIAEELEIPMVDVINFEEGQDEEPRGCEETVVELEESRIILARELDVEDDLEDDPVPIDQNVPDTESEESAFVPEENNIDFL